MKMLFKCSNYFVLILFALTSLFALGFGCNSSKSTPDPLAGWQKDYNPEPSDQIIEKDCQAYIHTLSPEEQKSAGPKFFYKDGTGQHAVQIMIGINNKVWRHVLIYDKDNKRIKAIKYVSGDYHS
jgi:hypothetical protein